MDEGNVKQLESNLTILKNKLRNNSKDLLNDYLLPEIDDDSIVYDSVAVNTIRAYHCKKYRPLSIYQSWAYGLLKREATALCKETNFETLHDELHKDLKDYWYKYEGDVSYYKINKLIDLFLKVFTRSNKLTRTRRKWLLRNIFVPLDRFSLTYLRGVTDEFNIPKNPSMKFATPKNYLLMQKKIREIVDGYYPIMFDLLAWDEAHKTNVRIFEMPIKK